MGYDLVDKQLHINKQEADTIRYIFQRYLELGSVERLKHDLERNNIKSKIRVSVKGRESGGANFSRGALYHLLRNPVFIGKTKHKDDIVWRNEHFSGMSISQIADREGISDTFIGKYIHKSFCF